MLICDYAPQPRLYMYIYVKNFVQIMHLTKAFDSVPHKPLIEKLQAIGHGCLPCAMDY